MLVCDGVLDGASGAEGLLGGVAIGTIVVFAVGTDDGATYARLGAAGMAVVTGALPLFGMVALGNSASVPMAFAFGSAGLC